MNGRPGVRERTRRIVMNAAEELGANQLLMLRPSRTLDVGLVGVIVPELANPIFPAIAQLLEARLAAAGYTCVLGCVTGGVDEVDYLATLAERGVTGMSSCRGATPTPTATRRRTSTSSSAARRWSSSTGTTPTCRHRSSPATTASPPSSPSTT